jgi:hypothetical protein
MRNIQNVVDFSELCVFAEQIGVAHYNAAHDILDKNFYPDGYGTFEVYKSDVDQYTDDNKAIEIMVKFMESKGVEFINIVAG